MKVAVFTIALNEAAHAERWANSAADADYRIVADTGSTDDTVERLTKARVTVHRIAVRPWRFDVARNAAMALLPADVDVCLTMDMDRFVEPGWRPKLEAVWTPEMTALFCRVVYRSSIDDPTPLGWPAKNFHHRWGYRFKRPVHEALVFTGSKEVTGSSNDIVIHEVQDHAKPTRSQYLTLMELAHKEDPDDARICFWLGRDYMWGNQYERGIELLQRYLSLPTSTWADERSEAMRYLARMQPDNKMHWLDKARLEAPHRREIWLDLAEELHAKSDWLNLFWACTNGIEKTATREAISTTIVAGGSSCSTWEPSPRGISTQWTAPWNGDTRRSSSIREMSGSKTTSTSSSSDANRSAQDSDRPLCGAPSDPDGAEACFRKALDLAGARGEKSLAMCQKATLQNYLHDSALSRK